MIANRLTKNSDTYDLQDRPLPRSVLSRHSLTRVGIDENLSIFQLLDGRRNRKPLNEPMVGPEIADALQKVEF
jgi:hypothetical protein